MRGLTVSGFLAAILPFVAIQTAWAEPAYLEVRANSTAVVAALPSWDGQCRSNGYPKVHVRGKPGHGRITVERSSRLAVPANAGACAGKTVSGAIIRYTPNRNFQGQDSAVLVVYSPDGKTYFRADVVLQVQ
jgi:hypothetical protein